MYYVYVLYSLKDYKFYIGKCKDLYQRIEKHNNGWVRSTRYRRPLQLVHSEVFAEAKDAYLREKELKYPSAGKFKEELRKRLKLNIPL